MRSALNTYHLLPGANPQLKLQEIYLSHYIISGGYVPVYPDLQEITLHDTSGVSFDGFERFHTNEPLVGPFGNRLTWTNDLHMP